MFEDTEVIWMNVLPVYRSFESEEETSSRAHLRDTNGDMLPTPYNGQFKDVLTLCALDSMYRAFPFRDGEQVWKRMRRYDGFIVEELSEVASGDLFPMLSCISYSAYLNDKNWPKAFFVVILMN